MLAALLLPLVATASSVAAFGADLPPIPADKTTPTAQRLALGEDPSIMALGWNTYSKLSTVCVQYGTNKANLDQKACSNPSTSATYPSSRTYANSVRMTGLKPSTKYYYKVVSTNSTIGSFQSGRVPGDFAPITMAVTTDLGVYGQDGYTISDASQKSLIPRVAPSSNHSTIGRLLNTIDTFDWVIHPGDLGYADDWYLKPDNLLDGKNSYESILEQFYGEQFNEISQRKPWMVSPGNHEAACKEVLYFPGACPPGQENFTDFMIRFGRTMPTASPLKSTNATAVNLRNKAKSLAKPPFWYSYDAGSVHMLFYSTETDFPNAPDQPGGSAALYGGPFGSPNQQLDFIKADLASVDRRVTPWVIAAGHRPWYTTGTGACDPCRAAFEAIFYKYGVDVAVYGHQHNSQRFLPVYNNTADPAGMNNPKAPLYVVAGGSGNIEGLTSVGTKQSYNAFAYDGDFSYATITAQNKTNLDVTFIRSTDGYVLDRSTLYKKHDVPFVVQS